MLYKLFGWMHTAVVRRARSLVAALEGQRGQGTVEYVGLILLVSLLMVGMVAAMKGFNGKQGTELAEVIVGGVHERKHDAIELIWEGTQSGPLATPDGQELPPSNKRIAVKSVEVIETEDGKIKVLRHYFDLMTILQ